MLAAAMRLAVTDLHATYNVVTPFTLPHHSGSLLRGVLGRALRSVACARTEGPCAAACQSPTDCVYTHLFDPICNYEWDSRALLSLLLVGLPELRERLSRRHQRSLYSRIHHRLHIDATAPDDTADYLRHRLRLAGAGDRELFTGDAIAFLHEAAGGLRDLDRLAEASLRDAWRRKKKLVERDAVMRVAEADR